MTKIIISILIGLLFVCGVQIGIYKGRLLEKEKSAETINENANLKKELLKYEKAINVIECESNGKHHGVWGDNQKSYGALQIQQATFKELSEEMGKPNLHWWRFKHQLQVFFYALENDKAKKWSCYTED